MLELYKEIFKRYSLNGTPYGDHQRLARAKRDEQRGLDESASVGAVVKP